MKNKRELIYKELSYDIIGAAMRVSNELGYGYQEKYYEKALCKVFEKEGIKYKNQVKCDLKFEGEKVGVFFLDFLVDNKIIVEIKVGNRFHKNSFDQIISYLKVNNKKLGILIKFTNSGIKFVRIVNFDYISVSESEIKLGNFKKFLNK
jgi:GxxExxY protein